MASGGGSVAPLDPPKQPGRPMGHRGPAQAPAKAAERSYKVNQEITEEDPRSKVSERRGLPCVRPETDSGRERTTEVGTWNAGMIVSSDLTKDGKSPGMKVGNYSMCYYHDTRVRADILHGNRRHSPGGRVGGLSLIHI